MDDLLGRRFMMSDGCLCWRPAKAHRAFPLSSIPPPVFTPCLDFFQFSFFFFSFFAALLFSHSRSSSPSSRCPRSLPLGHWHNTECLWFLWERGNPAPRHFSSQCPRLQCSCGVLTAESPRHAQALGLFSAAQAKCAGPTLHLHRLGYRRRSERGRAGPTSERSVGFRKEKKGKGREEARWYLCMLVRRLWCGLYNVHELKPPPRSFPLFIFLSTSHARPHSALPLLSPLFFLPLFPSQALKMQRRISWPLLLFFTSALMSICND